MGNNINPVEDPMNLADQTDPVASVMVRQAYQNATEVGTPKITADKKGLSFHQSDKN